MSSDEGDHWESLQYNLPHTSMRDLAIQGNDLIVATHGRSFWVLDDISSLRQAERLRTVKTEAVLFKPGDAWRVRRNTNTDTPLPADEPAGENPPDGAAIDYALPASVEGTVTLEILDAANKVVRRYASTDTPEPTREEMEKQLIPLYWLRMPKTLPGTAGMHRWVWDLHYATPTAPRYEYPISAVPHDTPRTPQGVLAVPGTYTVRLTVSGKALTAPLTIKMDPRVTASSAELASLFKLQSSLSAAVTSSGKADLEAHSAQEQIEKLLKNAATELKDPLEKQGKEISSLLEGHEKSTNSEEEPGLDEVASEVLGLYEQVGQADASPTEAQQSMGAHIGKEAGEAVQRWERMKNSALPALNRKLNGSQLPVIDLERRPETMPEGGDED
jgi:hypothetical protein